MRQGVPGHLGQCCDWLSLGGFQPGKHCALGTKDFASVSEVEEAGLSGVRMSR